MVSNIETDGVWGLPVDVETFWSMAVFLEEPGIPMIVAKVTIKFSSKDTTCSWTVASLDAAPLGVFGSCLTMVYVIHLPIYLCVYIYIYIRKTYIYISPIYIYIYIYSYLSTYLPIYLSMYLPMALVHLFMHQFIYL